AQTIDLPLETMVVSGSYDAETEKIVLTLKNGQTVEFSVAALVSGLQSEITAQNKLDADLVDDSESTNKFVTAADKSAWTGKQDALTFNGTYNASTNPAATVSTVTNAIAGLDVASAGGSGKYISAISETDGKISATAETMDTVPTASSTKAVTSGGIHTPLAALVNGGAKNRLPYTLAYLKENNTAGTWSGNAYTRHGITFTVNNDLTITVSQTGQRTGDSWLDIYGTGTTSDFVGMVCSGCPEGGTSDRYGLQCGNNNWDYGTADGRVCVQGPVAIVVRSGYDATAGLTFKPMVCSPTDWSVSHEYVPYCPSLYELYQMILNAQ
ncbi:MAG: hypothetical protein J6T97_05595, partial [Bacteroidaceae bacterium]|nr:hypothetical protein [Bacteroidaceae bacterium]